MCHHRHRRHEREVERLAVPAPPRGAVRERDVERFAAPTPPSAPVRVGDADRERVVDLLRDHAAAGRLEPDELEDRLGRAYGARHGSDLQAVLAELPAEQPAAPARPSRPRAAAAPLLPLAVGALIALAALTSAWWLLWLIWPIVIVLGPRRHYRRARF
jgi:uncharacterized protein DUF1707